MGLVKPLPGITAGIVALVVGGVIWYGESRPPVLVEKPQPVAAVPTPAPKVMAAPQPPVTESASPVVVAVVPAKTLSPAEADAAETARQAAQDRKVIIRRYGKLFDQLGLDPAQREKLTQLLVDNREASVDYASAAASLGVDASEDSAAFASSVYEVRQEINDKIKALLGDEGYAKFQAGDEAIKQTAVVDRAQKALKGTDARLSQAQADQLQGVLQDLGVHYVTDEVINRASGFLSESQLEVLQQQATRRANGAAKDRVQKAIKKNKT